MNIAELEFKNKNMYKDNNGNGWMVLKKTLVLMERDYDVFYFKNYKNIIDFYNKDLTKIMKLTFEKIEKPIVDWEHIPKDTVVYVRNCDEDNWEKAHFHKLEIIDRQPRYEVYDSGATSKTCTGILSYSMCRLPRSKEFCYVRDPFGLRI